MAKIPMGNFGNAMPQVQRIQMPQDQSGQMIANTLQNVGQVVAQADQQQREREAQNKQLENYNNQLAEKEGQLKVDDFLSSKFSEQVTLLRNDVANGVKTSQQASDELKIWSDDQYKELSSSLPMHAQQQYKAQIDSSVGRQGAGFLPLQLKANEQRELNIVDRAFSEATRRPTNEREPYFLSYLKTANIPVAEKEALLLKLRVESNKIDVDGRILSAVDSSNIDELRTLSTELGKGAYKDLNGGQVQDYQASIASKIHTIQSRQQVEENKRISESNKVFNEFRDAVLTGRNLDSAYIDNVRKAVVGTPSQADFDFYLAHSNNFQKFSKLGTSEQLKLINQTKANMKNSSSADPVREEKVLNVYQSTYNEKLKTAKENPNQLLAENGIQVPELNPAELKINPQGFIKNLVQVGGYQLALKASDGNVAIKPFSDDVLPQVKDTVDKLPIDQKLNFIGNLIGQTKDINGGNEIWKAALKQVGGDDPSYAAAGLARFHNYRSTEGRDLATSIISGAQLLKNEQFAMPKEKDLRAKFNAYIGQTITGESANKAYEVFKAVYADTMVARHQIHVNADESPKDDITKTALGMVTGGVYEQAGTSLNYMGGKTTSWKVTKPYGMTDAVFAGKLDKGYKDLSKQTGRTVADLKTLFLKQGETRSNGLVEYRLLNTQGKPLVVNGTPWLILVDGVTK
ncbi:methyl-coenzyme M reductase [Acinetobacter corruptisaponis]|uniref:Methyl-coenzyme M reductase n=1 Tax=Acinetobacter corruptisaponis TaxID=3045147 RepID=A0ABY8S5E4_9GAMM|nr:methyl-coenzyme M reductase [Acinetobacter sp. KCTC 92772]WHP06930.1 methyl-coenzyme M reductase [Acinetobacter sp. KCTC 92772]